MKIKSTTRKRVPLPLKH